MWSTTQTALPILSNGFFQNFPIELTTSCISIIDPDNDSYNNISSISILIIIQIIIMAMDLSQMVSGRGSADGSYDSQRLSTSSDKGSTGGSIGDNEAHVSTIMANYKCKG